MNSILPQILSLHQNRGEEGFESMRNGSVRKSSGGRDEMARGRWNAIGREQEIGARRTGTRRRPARSLRVRSSRLRTSSRPPGDDHAAARSSISSCAAASAGSSSADRRHRMSGSRRIVPKPGTGRIEQHAVEPRCKGKSLARRPERPGRSVAPDRGDRPRQQVDAPAAYVGRDDQPIIAPSRAAIAVVLPPGDAHASRTVRQAGGGEFRNQLRGFVLDQEQTVTGDRRQQRIAALDHSPSGANRVGSVSTPAASSRSASASRESAQGVCAQREGGGLVVEQLPAHSRFEAVPIQPPRREPSRMRQRCREYSARKVAGTFPRKGASHLGFGGGSGK